MTTSNRDRVGKGLELLREGMFPFVQREMRSVHGKDWARQGEMHLQGRGTLFNDVSLEDGRIDVAGLLSIMLGFWDSVFRRNLGPFERTLVNELINTRNRWAHQEPFNTDDTYRALDSVQRLLTSVGAPEGASQVDRERQELLRTRFEEGARREKRKVTQATLEGMPSGGLKPWREVIEPHPDVISGRYVQAEFAADLAQVASGAASDEYGDPVEFFRRTYITDGLNNLLANALKQVTGKGGDPVLELQTNFGGGKTHSMLAIYHLFSGVDSGSLPGVDTVLEEAGIDNAPSANRAVLVGHALSPSQPRTKSDGTIVNTLWGEMAWQLGGSDGYAFVAEDDRAGTSPGSETLRELFALHAPCVVLIDEWVAYARQLYQMERSPGGSFEANTNGFAQSLTEAAKAVPGALVVVSLPESTVEVGSEGGQIALDVLKNTVNRIAAPWRPASSEESFEIVRRRLFQPITERADFQARDGVLKAFADQYRKQKAEFPEECAQVAYEKRLEVAYPIHPELFDRLYGDWSTLDRFQRTRGVLRFMANVIHALWEANDRGLMIMPSSIPLHDAEVQSEITRYLTDPWVPIIELDIDGANSAPMAADRHHPNLGKLSASRRVARTVFMGSAPRQELQHKGISERNIKLGCAQPGESVAIFGDALRRLTDESTHLYVDSGRYWYDTQPSVTRTAQDLAARVEQADVVEEIKRRLRPLQERKNRAEFARVHVAPATSADVPDEMEAGLVIIGPEATYRTGDPSPPAKVVAKDWLERRGNAPRTYQNSIVFLAPDSTRLDELDRTVRQYLAWKQIDEQVQKDQIELGTFQRNQAKTRREQTNGLVDQHIGAAWIWALVPTQQARNPIEIEAIRAQGQDLLTTRTAKKLIQEGHLAQSMGGGNLRLQLDRVPLWRGDHVPLRQLWEDFAKYPYLQRIVDWQVLQDAVRDGVGKMMWEQDGFAAAEGYDEAAGRYIGLRAGDVSGFALDGSTLVVKPDVARRQLDAERAAAASTDPATSAPPTEPGELPTGTGAGAPASAPGTSAPTPATEQAVMRRFYGSTQLNELRMSSSASQIADEIVRHLAGLVGSSVTITLEVQARVPGGIPPEVIRIVSENARTLGFASSEFDED